MQKITFEEISTLRKHGYHLHEDSKSGEEMTLFVKRNPKSENTICFKPDVGEVTFLAFNKPSTTIKSMQPPIWMVGAFPKWKLMFYG